MGLGNPGPRYENTRHNLGFIVIDALAAAWRASWSAFASFEVGEVRTGDSDVLLVKPRTYMNRSGTALGALIARGDLTVEDGVCDRLLVVLDDIALPLGRIRLRQRGSDGGHNGLKSIIASSGTREFPRLRLGVGPVPDGEDPADFVLEPFTADEREAVRRMVGQGVDCVEDVLRFGVTEAMNRHNSPRAAPETD